MRRAGFTLLELLIVMAIMALVAGISLPAMKGMRQTSVMTGASHQLLDDLGYARHRAISDRTTVYVVFAPPVDPAWNALPFDATASLDKQFKEALLRYQFTGYRLFVERNVGDQPGSAFPRYLTDWKQLPEGVFIPAEKFRSAVNPYPVPLANTKVFEFNYKKFPYPKSTSLNQIDLPYISFDYLGRVSLPLTSLNDGSTVVPLARGSIFLDRDNNGLVWATVTPLETPGNNSQDNYHHLRIDALTGRAKVERPEIK